MFAAKDPTLQSMQDASTIQSVVEKQAELQVGRMVTECHASCPLGEHQFLAGCGVAQGHPGVLYDDVGHPRTLALFPEDRCAGIALHMSQSFNFACRTCGLHAGRANGALLLARRAVVAGVVNWSRIFWVDRLPRAAKACNGIRLLQVLVCVPADRAGQRVEAASPLVRQKCAWLTCWRLTLGLARGAEASRLPLPFCCGTKRICFHISWRVGATCSVRISMCCSTI